MKLKIYISKQNKISASWNSFLVDKKNKNEFLISSVVLIAVLFSLTRFLNYVENRNGTVLNDPVISSFTPVDLTWFTFTLIYFSLILAVLFFIRNPAKFLLAIQAYSLLIIFRMTAMYFAAFDPPPLMIHLSDPFAEVLGAGTLLTKDLFFSGHTATLFLFYLISDGKPKIFYLCATIIIAVSVLLQHVHYSIDVIAAFFFSYLAFYIVTRMNKIRKKQ